MQIICLSLSPEQKNEVATCRRPFFLFKFQVEGDGTLVPATDDDVMEVEHMLKDDKKYAPSIESMEKSQDYASDAVLSSRKSGINSLEGIFLSSETFLRSG